MTSDCVAGAFNRQLKLFVPVWKRRSVMHGSQFDGSAPRLSLDRRPADAHGRAALLLVEYLMHHLVDNELLSREDFIYIVDGAAEVECGEASIDTGLPLAFAESLLYPTGTAFRKELGL